MNYGYVSFLQNACYFSYLQHMLAALFYSFLNIKNEYSLLTILILPFITQLHLLHIFGRKEVYHPLILLFLGNFQNQTV